MSGKGQWIAYQMHYASGADTLFVKNTRSRLSYGIPLGHYGRFAAEHHYLCTEGDGITVLDLKNGHILHFQGVSDYGLADDDRLLVTLETGDRKRLAVRDLEGRSWFEEPNVKRFMIGPLGRNLIYVQQQADGEHITLLSLGEKFTKTAIAQGSAFTLQQLVWQANAQSVAFTQTDAGGDPSVCFYDLKDKATRRFKASELADFPSAMTVEAGYSRVLEVCDDGQQVFFGLRRKTTCSGFDADSVQLWNGNDKVVFGMRKRNCETEKPTRTVAWWPRQHRAVLVGMPDATVVLADPANRFAVNFDPKALPDNYSREPDADFYLTEIETGRSRLWLEKQSTEQRKLNFSPDGKFAAYFRDGDWWVLELGRYKAVNLTRGLSLSLVDTHGSGVMEVYGIAGWGDDGHSLIFYDAFDLWQADVNGTCVDRLTAGRESKVCYRAVNPLNSGRSTDSHYGVWIDLDRPLLLEAHSGVFSGLFFFEKGKPLGKVVWDTGWRADIFKAEDGQVYGYFSERFDRPAVLMVFSAKRVKPAIVAQTNLQHNRYQWGHAETIDYVDSHGNALTGALFYPAGYQTGKQYPMIVRVYEREADYLNKYFNPAMDNETGFNVANLTAKGYLVLFPSIAKRLGDPGVSAVDCVLAAVKCVVEKGIVNAAKIGLFGHSFGGYETNFIITRTPLFAAAVSGAGVSDLRSHYLSLGLVSGKPEIWRFEHQQWFMDGSLFEDAAGYERNSPMPFAAQISTPLLLWAGEKDPQVDHRQSIYFYNALRRLGKKVVLALYPGENHVLLQPHNQRDLTERTEAWFDYWLRDQEPPDWIAEGIGP